MQDAKQPTCMTTHTTGGTGGSEQNDSIAKELDIITKGIPLFGSELGLGWI